MQRANGLPPLSSFPPPSPARPHAPPDSPFFGASLFGTTPEGRASDLGLAPPATHPQQDGLPALQKRADDVLGAFSSVQGFLKKIASAQESYGKSLQKATKVTISRGERTMKKSSVLSDETG